MVLFYFLNFFKITQMTLVVQNTTEVIETDKT